MASRAEEECARILKIAGSPYEEDSGERWNTDATRAAGVLVINRYDWSHWDSRGDSTDYSCLEEDEEDEVDSNGNGGGTEIGIADYAAAGRGGKCLYCLCIDFLRVMYNSSHLGY